MKKLFSVLKYTSDYEGYTALNIIFNVLFALFSAATLSLLYPFSELLFKSDDAHLNTILLKGSPEPSFSSGFVESFTSYWLATLIVSKGKAATLIFICCAVFALTFIKNLCRYLAMFFIAPIRN